MNPSVSDSSLKIFISYCHEDIKYKDKLETYLQLVDEVEPWADTRIGAGQDWRQEIDDVLNEAAVMVLLITTNFLGSQFIRNKELPKILARRENEGLRVFPIIAKQCPWKLMSWLESMQVRPKDAKPVWRSGGRYADDELTQITYEIGEAVKEANIINSHLESAAEKARAAQVFAARRQRVEDEVQQNRARLFKTESRLSQIDRWKILQDTQAKIFEIQTDVTTLKASTQDAAYKKWDEYLRA